MKNTIYTLILLLFATFIASCSDDDEVDDLSGPFFLTINGPDEVVPGVQREYSVENYTPERNYTWSVEGPAQIIGDASGQSITVEFTGLGEAVIKVENNRDNGNLTVAVEQVEPEVTTTLESEGIIGEGMLSSGQQDTIFFEFNAPLTADPSIAMNTGKSFFGADPAFTSGTLGDLVKINSTTYYAIYTAGAGNGTPEAAITGLEATETFTSDELHVLLFEVDNTAPVVDLSFSDNTVSDGTEVTVTATFSEPVRFENPADSALLISYSGGGMSVTGDTLQSTDDPRVYSYTFTADGGGADGTVTFDIENVVDMAGNPLAAINNNAGLTIDNNFSGTVTGTAMDSGDFATISMTSTESGTGQYVVLNTGADAPTSADDFDGGIASGSMTLNAGVMKSVNQSLPSGDYDVYFIGRDEADNYSAITTVGFTMD